jgi:hypothetical protein
MGSASSGVDAGWAQAAAERAKATKRVLSFFMTRA